MLHCYVSYSERDYILVDIQSKNKPKMISQRPYRERIYIVKDIILKLVEYGRLNQTALISTCGLNFKKHSPILDKLQSKGLISKTRIPVGKRTVTAYKPTEKGIDFSRQILEPYEIMFPRTNTILV
jgi:predicted transcriptional regulator